MIFWHESSATEPGGTARDGRAHEPGAANIPAMPVAGAAPLISVSQAGSGQRRGSCDYGADRSALPGPALLWLAPDGGMAGDPRPSRQPQAGAAPDAAAGTGSDLPAPEYEQAGSGTQDLSVSAARAHDGPGCRPRGCRRGTECARTAQREMFNLSVANNTPTLIICQ